MQPQFKKNTKALEVIISGSYKKNGDGEIVDFDDVKVIMPKTSEFLAMAAARKRYAYTAIKAALNSDGTKKYEKPIEHVREVQVDAINEIEHEFDFYGKGIKEMSEEDLQHLAVEKKLRSIPLPKRKSGLSLRAMRQEAYLIYSDRVLGVKINMNDKSQSNYSLWPDIIPNPVEQAQPVVQNTVEQDFSGGKGQNPVEQAQPVVQNTVEQANDDEELILLKEYAEDAGLEYSWDVTKDELKEKLKVAGIEV